MPIAYCTLEIYLPYAQSLKEKRMVLRKAQDRLRARSNFSIAEVDYQDLWQRAKLAAVTVGRVVLAARLRFVVDEHRVRRPDVAVTRPQCLEAQIDVVVSQGEFFVEPADALEHRPRHQQACAGDGADVVRH